MTVQASPSRACCLEQISSIFSDMHGLEFKNDKKGGPRQTLTCIFANLNCFFFSNVYLENFTHHNILLNLNFEGFQ